MHIQRFTFNPFQTNCYVCHDDGEAVLIDPSCSTDEEIRTLEKYLDGESLDVRHLLLTHAHIDHILGCAHFARKYGQGFQLHRDDEQLLQGADRQAEMFGVEFEAPPAPKAYLDEGDAIELGSARLDVLHTPGHSPGSICFFDDAGRSVVSGDVLFQRSIGRTDLWRGSLPELMQSIFQKLIPLGDDVRVCPGHGPETTVGEERASNPFLTQGYAQL